MSDQMRNDPERGKGMEPGRLGLLWGFVISIVLSAALVISAAKAGITPGVSPLVVLVGWVSLGAVLGPRLKRFLAISQVTGSAGAAVTAGVVFTAPIIQILYAELGLEVPPVDVPRLMVASLAGALLGFGFVGLATRRFLTDPRLPAPEAVAADRLIETAVERPEERPQLGPSLMAGLVAGFVAQGAILLGWIREEVFTFTAHLRSLGPHGMELHLPIPAAPIYLGIGALLTLPTALLVFAGGLVNAVTTSYAASAAMPDTTFRWIGGAAMVVAVLYSLISYLLEGRRIQTLSGATEAEDALLELDPRMRTLLYGSIGAGAALLLLLMVLAGATTSTVVILGGVALILVSLLSGLGGLLSLQVGSSASPVSGTVFMGMLVLSLTALGIGLTGVQGVVLLVPLVVAACVAICAANDSSQDYKTMQLNGYRVADGFLGQLLGLLGGAIVVPLTLWLAHEAYALGSPDLPAPQASFFATVLQSLFLDAEIPLGPVLVGAVLGLVAVAIESVGKRRGVILSSLAFAVGIYLPSVIGTGIMLGSIARFVGAGGDRPASHGGILNAAGLITGDALASLILGVLIIAGVNYAAWGPASPPVLLSTIGGGGVLILILGAIAWNHRRRA
jgi:putative OPT family oligopeptide transporter